MKLFKAFSRLTLYHFLTIFLSLLLVIPLWSLADGRPVVFSTITLLMYACTIYSIGWRCGERDGRKIPGYYPDKLFPIKLSVLGAIIPIILLVFVVFWPDVFPTTNPLLLGEYEFFLTGNRLQGTVDMLYKLWYFPFETFLGNGRIATYVLALFIQPIFLSAGYFIGLTRFRLFGFLFEFLVFKKKEEEKPQKSPWNP